MYKVATVYPLFVIELNDCTALKGMVSLVNIEGSKLVDKGYSLNEIGALVKDIVPIPLTPEILEKNGWKKEPSENVTWYKYCTGKSNLYICKDSFNNKDWLVCVGLDKHYIANILYVHQLQNLLFGLWLDSDMIV